MTSRLRKFQCMVSPCSGFKDMTTELTTRRKVACGWMHLFDNLHRRHTDKSLYFRSLLALDAFLIVGGLFIMVTGTWAAALSIRDSYATGNINSPFSCADNSGST
jgi:hypothetical protein